MRNYLLNISMLAQPHRATSVAVDFYCSSVDIWPLSSKISIHLFVHPFSYCLSGKSNNGTSRAALKIPVCQLLNNNCLLWFSIICYVSISACENSFLCLFDRISHMGNIFAGVLNTWVRWKHHQIFDKYEAIVTLSDYTRTRIYEQIDKWGQVWRSCSWTLRSSCTTEPVTLPSPSGRISFYLLVCTIFWRLAKDCESRWASDFRLTCKWSFTCLTSLCTIAVQYKRPYYSSWCP